MSKAKMSIWLLAILVAGLGLVMTWLYVGDDFRYKVPVRAEQVSAWKTLRSIYGV